MYPCAVLALQHLPLLSCSLPCHKLAGYGFAELSNQHAGQQCAGKLQMESNNQQEARLSFEDVVHEVPRFVTVYRHNLP